MNLKALAYQLRRDTIDIICAGKAGHIGGDMSVMEILVELYFDQMKIDAKNRGRFESRSVCTQQRSLDGGILCSTGRKRISG